MPLRLEKSTLADGAPTLIRRRRPPPAATDSGVRQSSSSPPIDTFVSCTSTQSAAPDRQPPLPEYRHKRIDLLVWCVAALMPTVAAAAPFVALACLGASAPVLVPAILGAVVGAALLFGIAVLIMRHSESQGAAAGRAYVSNERFAREHERLRKEAAAP